MTIAGCLVFALWLLVIPLCMGAIPASFVDKKHHDAGFMWITGYVFMWAVFQMICVPLILAEDMGEQHFPYVVSLFGGACVLLGAVGVLLWCMKSGKKEREKVQRSKKEILLWILCALLIGIQLVASITMRYADGDDAFYVAVSTLTESSNTMYKVAPYANGAMELSARYGLAPFPIWIAFLARVSGIHTTIVAHTVVATVLIFMTYVIYEQIGQILFQEKRERIPLFLSLTALLVLFGDYSIYTVENFMIARSRQGKAALGNIIIPMVIFLFLLIFERIRKEQKAENTIWLMLAGTVTSACLCSTLGTFLMCLFLGVIGLCAGAVYRKWALVWKTAVCCVPAIVFAALYFLLG